MTWLLGIFLCLTLGGSGFSQVQVRGELGWQGQAAPWAVNPLSVTVENGTGTVLSGTLTARGQTGLGWKGTVAHALRAPLLLAPGGRARLVFPWPVESGPQRLVLAVEADGAAVAQAEVPVRLGPGKFSAGVGALPQPLPVGPVLLLSPEELPEDPLFLTAFAEIHVAGGVTVPARARAALAAWTGFLGGRVKGLAVPEPIGEIPEEDLREAVRAHGPRRPPVGLLVAGCAAYLFLLGYLLPALARGERAWAAAWGGLVALGFAVFYPLLYGAPERVIALEIAISRHDVLAFSLDYLGVSGTLGGVWEGRGLWVERAMSGEGERELEWIWGPDGPRTRVRLRPGEVRFLWRLGPAWEGQGEAIQVGALWPDALLRLAPPFKSLLAAVRPFLRIGDILVVRREEERSPGQILHRYRLRWDRRG